MKTLKHLCLAAGVLLLASIADASPAAPTLAATKPYR
jgi:hypothetical protein